MQTVLVLCHAVQRLQTAVSYQTEKAASTLKQLVAPAINTGKSNAHAPVFQQHLLNTLEHGAPAHTSDMTRKNVTLHVGNRRPSDSHLAQTAGQYFQGQRRSRCHARHQPQVKTNQLYLTASCSRLQAGSTRHSSWCSSTAQVPLFQHRSSMLMHHRKAQHPSLVRAANQQAAATAVLARQPATTAVQTQQQYTPNSQPNSQPKQPTAHSPVCKSFAQNAPCSKFVRLLRCSSAAQLAS